MQDESPLRTTITVIQALMVAACLVSMPACMVGRVREVQTLVADQVGPDLFAFAQRQVEQQGLEYVGPTGMITPGTVLREDGAEWLSAQDAWIDPRIADAPTALVNYRHEESGRVSVRVDAENITNHGASSKGNVVFAVKFERPRLQQVAVGSLRPTETLLSAPGAAPWLVDRVLVVDRILIEIDAGASSGAWSRVDALVASFEADGMRASKTNLGLSVEGPVVIGTHRTPMPAIAASAPRALEASTR